MFAFSALFSAMRACFCPLLTLIVFLGIMLGTSPRLFAYAPVSQLPVWTEPSLSSSPSARYLAAVAYDAASGQMVLFGGYGGSYLNDTWTWNGSSWTTQNPANPPSVREGAAMAYDAATGQVVLFGGAGSGYLNDTYTWNGSNWTQQSPATIPPARYAATMAYDAATGQMVLFGGRSSSGDLNDTYTWNGSTWTQQSPATIPPARYAATMAYDAATGQVVLFGGYGSSGSLNDTWTWNGSTWMQQSPATSPSARYAAAMASDAATGQVVLFGGGTGSGYLNDTWTWNGSNWTQQSPPASPSARDEAAMAYDAATGNLLLFGGYDGSNLNDTWTLQLGPLNLGTANVCPSGAATPSPCSHSGTVTFSIPANAAIGSINILTQGATGQDFQATPNDSSATLCAAQTYSSATTCTVDVTFTPKYAGLRTGAVVIVQATTGNVLATVYLYGTGDAPQIGFGPGVQSTLGGGLTGARGVAVDGAGNIYVGDYLNSVVKKIPPTCTTSTCETAIGGSWSTPGGVAVDGAGNVYVADYGTNDVWKVPPGCASQSCETAVVVGNYPLGVAVDASGNVYVANYNGGDVIEVPWTGTGYGTQSTVGSGWRNPTGVAVDASGDVFVSDQGFQTVKEVPSGCTSSTCEVTLGASAAWNYPAGMTTDGVGSLYVENAGTIVKFPPACTTAACSTSTTVGTTGSWGVAVDGSGNIYAGDTSTGTDDVVKVDLADAPSLTFATTTGVGDTDTTDGAKTVTVTNIGNETLTFPTPGSGSNPSYASGFPENTSDGNLCSATNKPNVAASQSCDVSAHFDPTGVGTNSGSVMLTDNALNTLTSGVGSAQQSISLSGTGIAAVPGAPTIGTATAGNAQATVTFTAPASNGGATITGYTATSNPGSITRTCSTSPCTVTGLTNRTAYTFTVTATNSVGTGEASSASNSVTPSGPVPTMTLSVTASGSAVTTVASGTVVTLTATVQSGVTAVTPGQVNFCDASAAHCTDIHLLGTAQLTSSGTAALKLKPGIGSHSYKAVFVGTSSYGTSTSSASSLSVTGSYTTTTTIAQSGSAGNYTLTATVTGLVNTHSAPPAPTGTLSFLDTTNSNYVLGTASLGAGTLAQDFAAQVPYTTRTGSSPSFAAVGDFNGDGIPDLAVANYGSSTVGIFLGKGDGTFQPQVTYATGTNPNSIAVGDFNGDGKPDLAITNGATTDNTVGIFLGKGDGTFQPQVTYATGSGPDSVAVGDFNGDGKLDLAVANGNGGGTVGIFLGNGDGTFNSQVTYPAGSLYPRSVAVADFNGDGKLDLAIANSTSNSVNVLLGKGDGTFQSQVTYAAGNYPVSVAVGDFNGDGIPDLAVANYSSGTESIFLNSGTGTFPSPANYTYTTGNNSTSVEVGDFNGDGIPDLAVPNDGGGVNVLLGKGDGTFATQVGYGTGSNPASGGVGDFNGDGIPDLAVPNQGSNNVSVLLGQWTETATASASGISPMGPSGSHAVEASYPGDSSFVASTSSTTSLTAQPAATTLTLSANPSSSKYSQQVVLTATLSPYTAQGHSTNGDTVTFSSNGTSLGTGTLSAGVAIFNVTSLPVGAHSLTAAYAGDSNFGSSNTTAVSFSVSQGTPTISISNLPASATYGGNFTPTFSYTGDGTTSVSSNSTSVCTVTSGVVHYVGVGTCSLTASATAGTNYTSATGTAQTFSVGQATQTIVFSNPGTQNFGTTPALTATASSGLTVTFSSSTTSVCTVTSGGALSFVTAGTCTINADQPGNGAYTAAPTVSQSFTIAAVVPGPPTIGTATASVAPGGDQEATISFTAPVFTGGMAITVYTATSSPGSLSGSCSSSPCTVTGLKAGATYTFTVTATNSAGPSSPSAASNSVVTSTPNLVVTTATDDAGAASNCTAQSSTAAGSDSSCSLRDALLYAANAGAANVYFDTTNHFLSSNTAAQNTITLTNGTLAIPSNTLVQGATSGSGATLANLVTVSGANASGIFSIAGGETGASIANLTIANGTSSNDGGGIANAGTLTVMGSTFSGNSDDGNTGRGGGAIYNSGTLTVAGNTFSGNSANGVSTLAGGGGIYNSGTLTVTNSTFTGNSGNAHYGGGAIFDSGTLTVTGSTFSGNSALRGGGIDVRGGTLKLANSIVAGNSASSFNADISGVFTDDGGNQAGTNSSGTSQITIHLAPLGNYGGPTPTMIPLPGSPAICAGTATPSGGLTIPSTDQRGDARTTSYGGTTCVDAGAVETNYSLTFLQQLADSAAAATIAPTPTVQLNESGAPIALSGVSISMSAAAGTLSGTTTQATDTNGQAAFTGLSIGTPQSGDTLTASVTLSGTPSETASVASSAFNIIAVAPTITFTVPDHTYGDTTFSVSASSNSPGAITYSVVSGPATISGSTVTLTGAGTATLEASQAASGEYAAATQDVTFNVAKATPTVSAWPSASAITYGQTLASSTLSGGAGSVAGTFAWTTSSTSPNAGTANYSVTFTPTDTTDYTTATGSVTLTVNKARATATLGSLSQTYTGSPLAATATTDPPGMIVSFTYNGSAMAPTAAGSYTVVGIISDTNYQGSTTGTLVIGKVTPTVSAWPSASAITYGQTLASSTLSGGGGSVAGTFAWMTSSTSPNAGTASYSIIFTPTDTTDYNTVTGLVMLTVNKATPIITWPAPVAIIYGIALSSEQLNATASYNGTAVPGIFAYNPASGAVLSRGTQTLSVTFTPADTADYNSASASAAVSVGAATLTVSANNMTKVYGTANPVFTGSISGALNGDVFAESFTTTATASSNVGTYAIVPSATGTGLEDYQETIHNGTLTVTKAGSAVALTSSTANANLNASVIFTATVTSATTGTPTGSVEFLDGSTVLGSSELNAQGVATYTVNTLAAGTHPITAVYAGDTNFNESTSAQYAQTVTAPDYSLTANTASLTLKAGQTGEVTFTFTPVGGYTGTVNFACTDLPANASCSFAPSSLTADGSNKQQTSQLTITTEGPNTGTVASNDRDSSIVTASIFWLPGLLFGCFLLWQRKKLSAPTRRLLGMLLVVAAISGMIGMTGCGFGNPQAPAGAHTVTVTATASASGSGTGSGGGGTSHTATFTLTITQ